jgi:hypothetical protein
MLFVWPKAFASSKKDEADKLINTLANVVYRKKLKLGYNAVRNLILEVYHNVPWMGTVEDGFKWSFTKADEVYAGAGEMEVVLIDEPNGLERMIEIKSKLREIYNIGLYSVHSTDTYEEALLAANLLFNRNSLHHLDFGHPDRFVKTWNLVMEYRQAILSSKYNIDDFVIDSSVPLALYGIRQAGDLDYLTTVKYAHVGDILDIQENNDKHIENNDKHIENHDKHIKELIYDPRNYFVFMGLKVITLQVLQTYKKNRGEKKDLNDIRMMIPYLKSNSSNWDRKLAELKSSWRVWKKNTTISINAKMIIFLNFTHLYVPIRFLYRVVKRRN